MRSPTIFFDMDGVLCDFVGGALKRHGKTLPAKEVGWNFWEQVGIPDWTVFWAPLADPQFWANLAPLEDGIALLERAQAAFPADRLALLSSGLCPGSCDGKREWLKRHLPGMEKHAIFCTTKELCAAPCKVLVDDHEPNVTKFSGAGGRAVLVPRPWNSRRDETDQCGRFDAERVFFDGLANLV